jgi:putative transposase
MPDDRYHRWRNSQTPGGLFFITASTLNRALRFPTPANKNLVTRSILQTSLALEVQLTHYVLLSNHFHLLARLPARLKVGDYMRTIKVDAHARFGENGPLWNPGYRSIPVRNERARLVKIDYIHDNPLKSRLAEKARGYPWSSAFAYSQECFGEDHMLDIRKAMNLYQN